MATKKRTATAKRAKRHTSAAADGQGWALRLYVAGQTPRCVQAFKHLQQLCADHLEGHYSIEVIDLLKNPTLAAGDQIIAIPTLVRKLPRPMKKIIGDLSNTEKVLVGLNLKPRKSATDGKSP